MADKKPRPSVAPKKISPPGFDPDTMMPVPSNPDWPLDNDTTKRDEYLEHQRHLAPGKRANPVMNFCKGGKVISSRKF